MADTTTLLDELAALDQPTRHEVAEGLRALARTPRETPHDRRVAYALGWLANIVGPPETDR